MAAGYIHSARVHGQAGPVPPAGPILTPPGPTGKADPPIRFV